MRCGKCQGYGHITAKCYGKITCARCGGNHPYEKCEVVTQKCPSCNGQHNAGSHVCPKYIEIKHTLEVSVANKISYSEAVKKIKYDKKNNIPEKIMEIFP